MTSILGYLNQPLPDLITNVTYNAVDFVRGQLTKKPKIEEPVEEKVDQIVDQTVDQKVELDPPPPYEPSKANEELAVHLETPSSVVRQQEMAKAFKEEESVSVVLVKKLEPAKAASTSHKSRRSHHHHHHHHSNRTNKK
ncbi:MAG: hypothetical protein JSS12_10470 [Verrucomicrobia bacterium]|nr:hypothetical protein [Verrucomicrobiota bacterium]